MRKYIFGILTGLFLGSPAFAADEVSSIKSLLLTALVAQCAISDEVKEDGAPEDLAMADFKKIFASMLPQELEGRLRSGDCSKPRPPKHNPPKAKDKSHRGAHRQLYGASNHR